MLFSLKNFVFQFYVEKKFLLQEMVGDEGCWHPPKPTPTSSFFLYGPDTGTCL